MPGSTPRLGLPYPLLAESADGPAALQALATALDQAGLWGQGLLAARGAAVGVSGRHYFAFDTGHLYVNTGTAWFDIGPSVTGPNSITAVEIANNAVGQTELADNAVDTASLIDGSVTGPKIADLAVTTAKLAAALKPSQGAGAGTEALRALGVVAGTALAGDAPGALVPSAVVGGTKTNGGTYTIIAPVAGTYILEFGAGKFNAGAGSTAILTSNKGGEVAYGDQDFQRGAGTALVAAVVLAGAEVVTITAALSGNAISILGCWAKLTRIA